MLWGQENRFPETEVIGPYYSEVDGVDGITFIRLLEFWLDPSILQLKGFLYYILPNIQGQLFEK